MFDVIPDLSSYKAMSNGIPISAITGRREYIKHLKRPFFRLLMEEIVLVLLLQKQL